MKNIIFKNASINALATFSYVTAVAMLLFYAPKNFEPNKTETVLIPIVMLSLLVFSAAITGILIFGKPAIWYFDGKKKEALLLFTYTLGIFGIITVLAFFGLYFAL
jgi:hypothetical protein